MNTKGVITLIDSYKRNPELWDTNHKQYFNKQARCKAYANMIRALDIKDLTVEGVKKKINNLRSHYSRELVKINKSRLVAQTEEDVYRPSLWWFHLLDFLRDVIVPRKHHLNDLQDEEDRSIETEKRDTTIFIPVTDSFDGFPCSPDFTTELELDTDTKPPLNISLMNPLGHTENTRKRKMDDDEDFEEDDDDDDEVEIPKKFTKKLPSSSTNLDEDEVFTRMLAIELKKIKNQREKTEVKLELYSTVMKAQLKEM